MACALALAVLAAQAAATPAPASPPAAPARAATYPLYGEVVSISDTLLVIKGGKGKPDRRFEVTPATVFKSGKQAATLKDVKPGRWVGGLIRKSASGGRDLVVSVNVDVTQKGGAPSAPGGSSGPAPAPKKKTS